MRCDDSVVSSRCGRCTDNASTASPACDEGARFAIENVLLPCAGFPGSAGDTCATSLFSDRLHPSSAAHALIGRATAARVMPPQVPVQSVLPVALALLFALFARRRQARKA